MNDFITLKFWGVRGSHPTTERRRLGVGGNTASLEIRTPYARLLWDAGTGIIPLGKARTNQKELPFVLLLSHWHHDHTQGLPFFAPLFQPTTRLAIVAPAQDTTSLGEKLRAVMSPPQFPIAWSETRAAKSLLPLAAPSTLYLHADGSLDVTPSPNAIRICALHSNAHPNGITLYRIEWHGSAIVYATDVESDSEHVTEIANFARGADLLIHDAQYQTAQYLGHAPFTFGTRGFGHSTNEMAAQVARAAQVKQLILFHHDPNSDDDTIARIQTQTRALFPHTLAAREGMTFHLKSRAGEVKHVRHAAVDALTI